MIRPIIRAAATLAMLTAAVQAQRTPVSLELSERLRLDAAAEDFSAFTMNRQGNAPFYVGPRREIVLPLPQDGNVRIYDSTGKRVTTLGRKGAGPGEFRSIFRLGWTRDTIWIYDAALRRITYFGGDYALLRSDVLSEAVHQKVEGDNPRVISDFAPSAIAPGGNVLGQILEVNGRDPVTSQLLYKYYVGSLGPDATVKKLVEIPSQAVSPRAYVPVDGPTRIAYSILPFANDALYAFSTAGDRFAILSTDPRAKTFTLTVRRGNGDTVFSRAYPFVPRAIPGTVADSAAAAAAMSRRYTPEVISRLTAETRKQIPPIYPPVASIVLARDGTTWVRTTGATGNDQAIVLDAKGNVTGTVALKRTLDIVEADGNRVWAVDVDDDGLASVVVFTLKPAAR